MSVRNLLVPLFLVTASLFAGCGTVSVVAPPRADSLTIAAVGDMMLGTNFPDNRLAADDGQGLLQPVTLVLAAADVAFGNLEGVLLEGGEAAKKCRSAASCYVFRSPLHYARYFKQAGFDVLSLANNHARDFGEEGRSSSMQALNNVGIQHTGRQGDIASWMVKGLKVAVIAYAPFGGSHDMLDIERAKAQVNKLKQAHDIVLVSFHGGAEGLDVSRIPFATEYFYSEDRGDVVAFSRAVVDAGADLVVGHGPHVPRAVELYKGRLIAYSLGNFATYFGISVVDAKGLAPILKARLAANGQFLDGKLISARQQRPRGPIPDPTHMAARMIAELTREDFPTTPLLIDSQGNLTRTGEQMERVADKPTVAR